MRDFIFIYVLYVLADVSATLNCIDATVNCRFVKHIVQRTPKVRAGGEDAWGFTAAEFKTAQNEGCKKQYPYKVGKKKVYMTPSSAEAQGLVRADKHPKSTRYGRQNPISERWNSEEQLVAWRAAHHP